MTNRNNFIMNNQSMFEITVDDTVTIILDGYRIDVKSGEAQLHIAKTKDVPAGHEIKNAIAGKLTNVGNEQLTPQGHTFEQQWER